jgi:hypothetical protein
MGSKIVMCGKISAHQRNQRETCVDVAFALVVLAKLHQKRNNLVCHTKEMRCMNCFIFSYNKL